MKSITIFMLLMVAALGSATAQYKIGDTATDFTLPATDGNTVSLTDYVGDAEGAIVIFTCNTCPFAVAYEDRINALDAKYKEKGYPVIAVNPNDPEVQPKDNLAAMAKRSADKGFTFPYLQDAGQQVYPQYGAQKTPHVFVLKKENGQHVVRYIGAIDDNHEDASAVSEPYVENAVDALIKGEKVATETTAAIGCTIKVKR